MASWGHGRDNGLELSCSPELRTARAPGGVEDRSKGRPPVQGGREGGILGGVGKPGAKEGSKAEGGVGLRPWDSRFVQPACLCTGIHPLAAAGAALSRLRNIP